MKSITEMNHAELLTLDPNEVKNALTSEEVIHMTRTLGAFWSYDYPAAKVGRFGLHAQLKSGYHSDAFFSSKILLDPPNIRTIIAQQMAMQIVEVGIPSDTAYIVGVPDSATVLGQEVARLLDLPVAEMVKEADGHIRMVTDIRPGKRAILIEDVCTRGTGFIEAVKAILERSPGARLFRFDPVILNRGVRKYIEASGTHFQVLPIAEHNIQDWPPDACRLCGMGSKPIKPKAEAGNWELLVNSQK